LILFSNISKRSLLISIALTCLNLLAKDITLPPTPAVQSVITISFVFKILNIISVIKSAILGTVMLYLPIESICRLL